MRRSWVQIPSRAEFFSGPIFSTAQVEFATVMIAFKLNRVCNEFTTCFPMESKASCTSGSVGNNISNLCTRTVMLRQEKKLLNLATAKIFQTCAFLPFLWQLSTALILRQKLTLVIKHVCTSLTINNCNNFVNRPR